MCSCGTPALFPAIEPVIGPSQAELHILPAITIGPEVSTRPKPAHPGSLWNTQDTEFSHFSSLYDKSNPTDPFVIFENS